MFFLLITFLALIAICFYTYLTWNNNFWKKCGVPFETPEFFYGNLKKSVLGQLQVGIVYAEIYQKFTNSPFVGILNLRNPCLLVRDPEVIKDVFVGNFTSYMDNDFVVDEKIDTIWTTNPFAQKGEIWKANRSRWISHMTPSKIKQYHERIHEPTMALLHYVRDFIKNNPGEPINTRIMTSTFFLDFIISGIFGVKINSFEEPSNMFNQVKMSIHNSSFPSPILMTLLALMPWLGHFYSPRFMTKELDELLMKVSKDIINCRKQTNQPNCDIYEALQKNSLLDGKNTFSELDLAGRIFGIVLDGSKTAGGVTSFGLYELACNQDVQTKLRKEINEATDTHGDIIPYEEIIKLPYLEMVFAEMLRMYPPLTYTTRVCTKNTVLNSHNNLRVDVKKGMTIVVPIFGLHTDPQYFPNPHKFDPERFTEGAKAKIPKYVHIPFGEGPRICIGMRLAIMESKVLLAKIIQNFVLTPAVEIQRPIKIDPYLFLAKPVQTLDVYFQPIQK